MISPKPEPLAQSKGLTRSSSSSSASRHLIAAKKVAADEGIAPFDVATQVGQQRLFNVKCVMLVFQHF